MSHEIMTKYRLGLQSSESLTEAGESASTLAHLHGHWQEASVSYHVGLFVSVLMTW